MRVAIALLLACLLTLGLATVPLDNAPSLAEEGPFWDSILVCDPPSCQLALIVTDEEGPFWT